MTTIKSGEYVNVGDEIGFEAQYLSDDLSTYVTDGKIYAATPGFLKIDEKKRTIKIDTKNDKNRKYPKAGDIITGQITSIRRHSIGVSLYTVNTKLIVDLGLNANIHISSIANKYIKKIEDAFAKFDIIRGEIVKKTHSEYRIRTDGPNFGVIKSYCKFCGTGMERKSRDQIICPYCNNLERKKLAADYNDIEIILDL